MKKGVRKKGKYYTIAEKCKNTRRKEKKESELTVERQNS
jgi:hypothetical protein